MHVNVVFRVVTEAAPTVGNSRSDEDAVTDETDADGHALSVT
jgi:hypothetical protein